MVWSKVQNFTQNKPGDRWVAIFEYLNGKGDITTNQGGWRWGSGGLTGGDHFLLFTYVDPGGVTRHYQYEFDYSDDSYGFGGLLQVNPDYDETIEDLTKANAFPFLGQYETSAETWYDPSQLNYEWKLWVSDEDPTAFMVSENDVKIGFWPSCKDGTRECPVLGNGLSTNPSYPQGGFINYGCQCPVLHPDECLGKTYGFPYSPVTSYSSAQGSLKGFYEGSHVPTKQAMYKFFPMRAGGAYFGTYATDIRQSIMSGTQAMTARDQISTSYSYGGFKVAYGADQYWLCLSGDAASSSIILSTGDQNPTSWLDN